MPTRIQDACALPRGVRPPSHTAVLRPRSGDLGRLIHHSTSFRTGGFQLRKPTRTTTETGRSPCQPGCYQGLADSGRFAFRRVFFAVFQAQAGSLRAQWFCRIRTCACRKRQRAAWKARAETGFEVRWARGLQTGYKPHAPRILSVAQCLHRDKPGLIAAVRCAHSCTGYCWGHKWVVPTVLVKFPIYTHPWALRPPHSLGKRAEVELLSSSKTLSIFSCPFPHLCDCR